MFIYVVHLLVYKRQGTYTKIEDTKFYTHGIPDLYSQFSSARHRASTKNP